MNRNLLETDSTLIRLMKQLQVDDVCRDTEREVGKEALDQWMGGHYLRWLDCIHNIPIIQTQHLFCERVFELHKNAAFIRICILSGGYHAAIRELRFALESLMQAYYLDTEHPTSDIACKMEILKATDRSREMRGQGLIDSLSVSDDEEGLKNELRKLYRELSQYTHSTHREFSLGLLESDPMRSMFWFNKELFDVCRKLLDRVMDCIYVLIMLRFPKVANEWRNNEQARIFFCACECKLTEKHLNKPTT